MADLGNIVRAYGWIRAYHRDLAKLFLEIQQKVSDSGHDCLTSGSIDTAQGKQLDRPEKWAPSHLYQYFAPKGRDDLVRAVLVGAYGDGVEEPYITLAAFSGVGIRGRVRDITYWWNESGGNDEPDIVSPCKFKDCEVQHRWLPVSRIASAADIVTHLVGPLLALDPPAVPVAAKVDPS